MNKIYSLIAAAALLTATATVSAETELIIFGGNATFMNSTYDTNSHDHDLILKNTTRTYYDASDTSSTPLFASGDFAPGVGINYRLGASPYLIGVGIRNSDHLDLSYQAGVRYNEVGSKVGVSFDVVRYTEDDIRMSLGDAPAVGVASVTYDIFDNLRLGAGVTTASLNDQKLNGLISLDLLFDLGNKSPTKILVQVFPEKPAAEPIEEVVVPIEEVTGERG